MAKHHPETDLLLEYAAGSLSEPFSLLVATHLALCPGCREKTGQYEAVGGAMLENLESTDIDDRLRDKVFAQLSAHVDIDAPAHATTMQNAALNEIDMRLPQPLRSYVKDNLEHLNWKSRGPVDEVKLLTEHAGVTSRLLKIKAGKAMPRHTHDGTELTLVLSGGFTDQGLYFGRGDVETASSQTDHAPVADDDEDCYCLAINDQRLRLSGPITRFLNPFVRL